MTLVRMRPRAAGADPVHRRVAEVMDAAGPQECDDMSVETAPAVMAAARVGRPVVRDRDGRCTGLVAQAEFAAVRDRSAYTDRVRLRDLLGDRGSFTSPVTGAAGAEHAMRHHRLGALPVVDEQGSAPGVLVLSR